MEQAQRRNPIRCRHFPRKCNSSPYPPPTHPPHMREHNNVHCLCQYACVRCEEERLAHLLVLACAHWHKRRCAALRPAVPQQLHQGGHNVAMAPTVPGKGRKRTHSTPLPHRINTISRCPPPRAPEATILGLINLPIPLPLSRTLALPRKLRLQIERLRKRNTPLSHTLALPTCARGLKTSTAMHHHGDTRSALPVLIPAMPAQQVR